MPNKSSTSDKMFSSIYANLTYQLVGLSGISSQFGWKTETAQRENPALTAATVEILNLAQKAVTLLRIGYGYDISLGKTNDRRQPGTSNACHLICKYAAKEL